MEVNAVVLVILGPKNYILVVSVVLREENQAVNAAIWLSAASSCVQLLLLPFLPLVQVNPRWQLWLLVESVPSVSRGLDAGRLYTVYRVRPWREGSVRVK